MKHLITLSICLFSIAGFCKNIQYVCSEYGLDIKDKPNANAKTIDIADYATQVTLLEVPQNNAFVKVQFYRATAYIEGYVYADELTSEKLEKRIKVDFDNATLYIKGLQSNSKTNAFKTTNNLTIDVFGDNSPFEKAITIDAAEYSKVTIYQQVEKGFVFYSNTAFCNLDTWKTFKSEWQELPPLLEENSYSTLQDLDFIDYNNISMAEIKSMLEELCQKSVANTIQPFKTLKENDMGIQTKKVHYKIELTDANGNITKNTLTINISLGC